MANKSDFRFGELQERSLHRQLKELYRQDGDILEAPLLGYIADIFSPARGVTEIQTGNFQKLKPKLQAFLGTYPVRIVLPVPGEKLIVRWNAERTDVLTRRRSWQKKTVYHGFRELLKVSEFLLTAGARWEVLITQEEDHRADDGRGSWRRQGVSKVDRILVGVLETWPLQSPGDFLSLVPPDLDRPFTNRDLAAHRGLPLAVARDFTACLKKIGLLGTFGRRGRETLLAETVS